MNRDVSGEIDSAIIEKQAALVEAASAKANALYARADEMEGVGTEVSVMERRADALARFANNNAGVLLEAGYREPAEEEIDQPKEIKLSPKMWQSIEEAVASVAMHDGTVERGDYGPPSNLMVEENGWSKDYWHLVKRAADNIGVLSFNKPEEHFVTYDSITLEMDNIIILEGLIAEGKLPEYLEEPLQDVKALRAKEAADAAAAIEPSATELEEIEASGEVEAMASEWDEETDPRDRTGTPPVYRNKTQRFAAVTKRVIREMQIGLAKEVARQYRPTTVSKNESAGELARRLKIHIKKAGENIYMELGGREIFDLEEELRLILAVGQANGPVHAAAANTAGKRKAIIMDIMNIGRNGDSMDEKDMEMLYDSAAEREEISMEGDDPKITVKGFERLKSSQIKKHRANAPMPSRS